MAEKVKDPPADLAAYLILDAVYPVVLEQHEDLAFSRKEWRDKNKRAAKALADQGKTPDQVVAALRAAYADKFEGYRQIVMLDKLREHWTKFTNPKPSVTDPSPYKPYVPDRLTPEEQKKSDEVRRRIMTGVTPKAIPS